MTNWVWLSASLRWLDLPVFRTVPLNDVRHQGAIELRVIVELNVAVGRFSL